MGSIDGEEGGVKKDAAKSARLISRANEGPQQYVVVAQGAIRVRERDLSVPPLSKSRARWQFLRKPCLGGYFPFFVGRTSTLKLGWGGRGEGKAQGVDRCWWRLGWRCCSMRAGGWETETVKRYRAAARLQEEGVGGQSIVGFSFALAPF